MVFCSKRLNKYSLLHLKCITIPDAVLSSTWGIDCEYLLSSIIISFAKYIVKLECLKF